MQIRSVRQRWIGTLNRLLLMAVLITWATLPSEAQEQIPHPAPARGTQLSERSRQALAEAEKLAAANDLKGAIKLLERLTEGNDAEVSVLSKLGELYAYSMNFDVAQKWFRRAIERADKSGEPLIGPPAMLGTMLFLLGRYREAIPLLEDGWRLGGRRIDSGFVRLLARAYEETGAMRAAKQAYETVLAGDLGNIEAWSALARIKAKVAVGTQASPGPEVPAPPQIKEFAEVINLGDPRSWSLEERAKGRVAQKRYAEALERSGVPLTVRSMRREIALAAIKPCVERTDDRSMNCVKSIALLDQTHPIHTLDTKTQRLAYLSLVAAHTDLGQYVHALTALERFIVVPAIEEAPDDAGVINKFLQDVFVSVSWDPKSSQLRENDTDDFVELLLSDPSGLVAPPKRTRGRTHRGARIPSRRSPHGIATGGARAPYGMASPEEDFATIGDWVNVFSEDFYALILLRIKQKNFELPVKVLLFQLATLNSDLSTGVNDRYLKALDSAINEAGESVSHTTLEAYAVAKRMFELMKPEKQHPRASLTGYPPKK
jgi:tetratricopeptide (TPR) repeat protein